MKTILYLSCIVGALVFHDVNAQTCGNLINGGNAIVVNINGRTDTFWRGNQCNHKFPHQQNNGSNAANGGSDAGGVVASADAEPTAADDHDGDDHNHTTVVQQAAPTKAQIRYQKKKDKERARNQKRYDRKRAKRDRQRERRNQKREKERERNAEGKGKGRKLVKKIVQGVGDGVVAVGEGAAMVIVGAGTGIIAAGEFLARPFKRCDCNGSGKRKQPKVKEEKAQVLTRHGRRVKDQPVRRFSKAKKKKRKKCGEVEEG